MELRHCNQNDSLSSKRFTKFFLQTLSTSKCEKWLRPKPQFEWDVIRSIHIIFYSNRTFLEFKMNSEQPIKKPIQAINWMWSNSSYIKIHMMKLSKSWVHVTRHFQQQQINKLEGKMENLITKRRKKTESVPCLSSALVLSEFVVR